MYGLTGHPLGHSMSPFIHKRLFELTGKNESYELFDIDPDTVKQGFDKAIAENDGLNVTIPYKQTVIDFVDRLDDSAAKYDSVNCIAKKDGEVVGYNTDCIGFLRSVPEGSLGGKVLLLGCGGVGRMMALEALLAGGSLTIAVIEQFIPTAETLKEELLKKVSGAEINIVLLDKIEGEFDLLINATPVGMYPKSDNCPVSEQVIKGCKNVFDAVYNPIETVLVKTAKKMGNKAVGGMSMLVLQAVAAHEIWYGAEFDSKDIDKLIKDAAEELVKTFQ